MHENHTKYTHCLRIDQTFGYGAAPSPPYRGQKPPRLARDDPSARAKRSLNAPSRASVARTPRRATRARANVAFVRTRHIFASARVHLER